MGRALPATHLAAMEPGHEDREDTSRGQPLTLRQPAAMEPGHNDREDDSHLLVSHHYHQPRWSPVTKTGKRALTEGWCLLRRFVPQWSSVTTTGKARSPNACTTST